MGLLLIWILASLLVMGIANHKNRSGIGYFFLSLLLSPLIGLMVVLLISTKKDESDKRNIK